MPELTRQQRAAGGWVSPDLMKRRRRVYTRDDADRPCEECGFPLVRQLVQAEPGMRTHPACDQPS